MVDCIVFVWISIVAFCDDSVPTPSHTCLSDHRSSEVLNLNKLKIVIQSTRDWEVPGDTVDAICSSDEERDANAAATALRSLLTASASTAQPKRHPRAATRGRGFFLSLFVIVSLAIDHTPSTVFLWLHVCHRTLLCIGS